MSNRIEEQEIFYKNYIKQIENDHLHSLDQKIAEFWNSAQSNEQKLLQELQNFDEKLKISERSIILLQIKLENTNHDFEKEKNEFLQTENHFFKGLKALEAQETKLSQEKFELIRKVSNLEVELTEKMQEIKTLNSALNDLLKTNVLLKNKIMNRDLSIAHSYEAYENSLLLREILPTENISKHIEFSSAAKESSDNKTISKLLDMQETISISNFEDLESINSSNFFEDSPAEVSKYDNVNDKNFKKENISLIRQNRQIVEKNELILLFLREKEEEIIRLNDGMQNLQYMIEEDEKRSFF